MNAPVGGLFTSRINQQLRELKGYTYGMFSGMTAGHDDGPFAVRGSVRTPVTGVRTLPRIANRLSSWPAVMPENIP